MCINPSTLLTGQQVACRECWQCRQRRVNDWAGRAIAEAKSSVRSYAVTLTYGRDENNNEDHLRSAVLTYSDVQKYFKRIRAAGYSFKYIVVGEYGSRKGRAHWHLVLFFKEQDPKFELRKNYIQKWWPHGHTFCDDVHYETLKYNLKYLLKDENDSLKHHIFRMSKKPPIGHEYFKELAVYHAEKGLAPQTLEYTFDEARTKKGKKIKFLMMRKTAENYLDAYIAAWQAKHGDRHIPSSELVEDHLDQKEDKDRWEYETRKKEIEQEQQRIQRLKAIEEQLDIEEAFNDQDEIGFGWTRPLETERDRAEYNYYNKRRRQRTAKTGKTVITHKFI